MTQPHPDASDPRKALARATVIDAPESYAVHIRTGHHNFAADEPITHGGGDTAPNPTQLALGALGACTAITLRMYAERHGWAIGRIHVQLQLVVQDDQPQIEREIHIEGMLDDAQRTRLLEIAGRTPVTRLFKEGTPISTQLAVS